MVLPAFDYDVEMLELILRHEYQHFLNRDQWKKTLIHLVRLLFWWNPMAILVQKEMDQTLELLCDYRTLKKLPPERHFKTVPPGNRAEESGFQLCRLGAERFWMRRQIAAPTAY